MDIKNEDYMMSSNVDSMINIVYDRCPVCERVGKSLACFECSKRDLCSFLILQYGEVKRSQIKQASVMFINRTAQSHLLKIHKAKPLLKEDQDRYSAKVQELLIGQNLESEIYECAGRVLRLKKVLANQRQELSKEKLLLADKKKLVSLTEKKLRRFSRKETDIKEFISKKQLNIANSQKNNRSVSEELREQQKKHLNMLTKYIFPIKAVKQSDSVTSCDSLQDDDSIDDDTVLLKKQLKEASDTAFLHGRWIDQSIANNKQLQISVGTDVACASLDGSYTNYTNWLASNYSTASCDPSTITSSMSESSDFLRNQAQRSILGVSAALSHAAQTLHVVRMILDVHLPHRVHFKIFGNPAVSPLKFSNAVKLFNSNLVFCCLREGVEGSTLHPLYTLRNLQILMEKLQRDGKRPEPCLPPNDLLLSMEKTLGLSEFSDDGASDDEEDEIAWPEWEEVSKSEMMTMPHGTASPYMSTNTQSSILTQPASVVASMYNWASGFFGTK